MIGVRRSRCRGYNIVILSLNQLARTASQLFVSIELPWIRRFYLQAVLEVNAVRCLNTDFAVDEENTGDRKHFHRPC